MVTHQSCIVSSERKSVFIVEPDQAVQDGLRALIGELNVSVRCYDSAVQFMADLDKQPEMHGCVLAEVDLPGLDTFEMLRRLRNYGPAIPVIVLLNRASEQFAQRALDAGAAEVINKPLLHNRLLESVEQLLR